MTRLDIRLLREFAERNDGVLLRTISSQRLQCLLVCLLLHLDRPVARQPLAFLFLPESTEAQARSNLRNLLHTLSQALPQYALSGDRAGIARTYKECRAVLQHELDVEPSRQTVEACEPCLRMETSGERAPLTILDPRCVGQRDRQRVFHQTLLRRCD
jgi:DNA-binding SARP family transcriptional activator